MLESDAVQAKQKPFRLEEASGDFDRHPSKGPLPPGAPPVCEIFRRYPDALERAAELDATYGRNPDLEKCRCMERMATEETDP